MTPEDKKTRDDWLCHGSMEERARRQKILGDLHGTVVYACAVAKEARMPNKVIEALLRGLAGDQ